MKVNASQMNLVEITPDKLDPDNDYVRARIIFPWALLGQMDSADFKHGRPPVPTQVAFGALLVQANENLSLRELVSRCSDSISIQYFLGRKWFTTAPLFSESSVANFSKRFPPDTFQIINELITTGNLPPQWFRINEAGERVCKDQKCEILIELAEDYLRKRPQIRENKGKSRTSSGADSGKSLISIKSVLDALGATGPSRAAEEVSDSSNAECSDSHVEGELVYAQNLFDLFKTDEAEKQKKLDNSAEAVEAEEGDSEKNTPDEEPDPDNTVGDKESDTPTVNQEGSPDPSGPAVKNQENEDIKNPDSADFSGSGPRIDEADHDGDASTACNDVTSLITEHVEQLSQSADLMSEVSNTRAPPHLVLTSGPGIRGPTENLPDDSQADSRPNLSSAEPHQIIDASQSDHLNPTHPPSDESSESAKNVQNIAENHQNTPLSDRNCENTHSDPFAIDFSKVTPLPLRFVADVMTILPLFTLINKPYDDIINMNVHEYLTVINELLNEKYNDVKHYDKQRRKILWGIMKLSVNIANYLYSSVKLKEKYEYIIPMIRHISLQFPHEQNMLLDATVMPANIKYPTDYELLNDARVILEDMSIKLLSSVYANPFQVKNEYKKLSHYDPDEAHTSFLSIAKMKKCPRVDKIKAVAESLASLEHAIDCFILLRASFPDVKLLSRSESKVPAIVELYTQQHEMFISATNACSHRIVSIEQFFVRPIYRGKFPKPTEFGLKVHLLGTNGYVYDIHDSWEAFNEGIELDKALEYFVQLFDHLPRALLADEIYKNRANIILCECLGIRCTGKRLNQKKTERLSELEKALARIDYLARIEIEGRIGTLKTRYGLARLSAIKDENQIAQVHVTILAMNVMNKVHREIRAEKAQSK